MKNEITIIPKIKIHPSKIILYNEIHYHHYKPSRKQAYTQQSTLITQEVNGKLEFIRVNSRFLNSARISNGELSKQAKKKLTTAIEYFLLLNKPQNQKSGNTGRHFENKIAFITLTLPSKQIHSDNEIKEKCLNQFLIELHKHYKITQYIWRTEYQKNGNIHFHILVNRFIPWNDVRSKWNRIINKLGYVDRYRTELEKYHKNGFRVREDLLQKWPLEKQLKAYKQGLKTDWHNPNSIDIHGIKNITNLKSYITKYMTKTENHENQNNKNPLENRTNIGRIWAASTVLANIKGAVTEVDSVIEKHLEVIKEHFKNSIFTDTYFTVISISIEDVQKLKCSYLIDLFYKYLLSQFAYSYQYKAC